MKNFRLSIFIVVGFIIIGLAVLSYADVPRIINYQGKFTDKDDNPLSGNYLVTFRFYDVASGEEAIWEEGHIISMNRGIFNALLGSITPLDVDFNKDLWLGIEVASDGEMTPRIKLASSVYALNAETVDMLNSTQLIRNDIDSAMSGSLTLKKDLILKGDISGPSRLVLSDAQGREYYFWMDASGSLRLKQGSPSADKDGAVIAKGRSGSLSSSFLQNNAILFLALAILIFSLIFYSKKKK